MRHTIAASTGAIAFRMPAVPERRTFKPGRLVDIGALRIARADIVGCRLHDIVERDTAGRIASVSLILAAVIVMVLGLVDLGWQPRAILGFTVLTIVAVVSFMEALGITRTVLYRLDILKCDGRVMEHVTASREEAERLADLLGPIPEFVVDEAA